MPLEKYIELYDKLDEQAQALWYELGARLLIGQERYGGFKFGEVDLDQMALEEIEDYLVYRAARRYMEKLKGAKSDDSR